MQEKCLLSITEASHLFGIGQLEHKDLEHPEREQDCCATCKSKFYPECTNSCGMLKED